MSNLVDLQPFAPRCYAETYELMCLKGQASLCQMQGKVTRQMRHKRGKSKASRSVFLSYEFDKDAGRRGTFTGQARQHCEFVLNDKSLLATKHDDKWRRDVKERMKVSDVVIVLLGPDTHSAPGVKDELSLAGEVSCPVVQLMPQGQNYGLVGRYRAVCEYKWTDINQMLRDPTTFAKSSANRGK